MWGWATQAASADEGIGGPPRTSYSIPELQTLIASEALLQECWGTGPRHATRSMVHHPGGSAASTAHTLEYTCLAEGWAELSHLIDHVKGRDGIRS